VAQSDTGKLLAAWLPREFASAVEALAEAHGVTRSDLIRAALLKAALEMPDEDSPSQPSQEGVT
jgi:ribbon-helix-helix CopG family protein